MKRQSGKKRQAAKTSHDQPGQTENEGKQGRVTPRWKKHYGHRFALLDVRHVCLLGGFAVQHEGFSYSIATAFVSLSLSHAFGAEEIDRNYWWRVCLSVSESVRADSCTQSTGLQARDHKIPSTSGGTCRVRQPPM